MSSRFMIPLGLALVGAVAPGVRAGSCGDLGRSGLAGAETDRLPGASALLGTWPNPVRGDLRIEFAVGRAEQGPVTISVYDVAGRRVARLVDGPLEPGWREVQWNGRDSRGTQVAAGVYFLRFEAGDVRETRKIIRMR